MPEEDEIMRKCYELAISILQDIPWLNKGLHRSELTARIQRTVEAYVFIELWKARKQHETKI